MIRTHHLAIAAFSLGAQLALPAVVCAQAATPADLNPAPSSTEAPRPSATPEPTPTPRPDVERLKATTEHVRQILDGSLPVGLDTSPLFDIDLSNEEAVGVESERLRGVIARAQRPPKDAGPVDAELFAARVALDRARLDFYSLPREQRIALVRQHEERQQSDGKAREAAELAQAQQRALDAETARQEAVAAAERAQTEAQRLVEEERARLLATSGTQADLEASLTGSRFALNTRAEQTLALRRRVRETLALRPSDPAAADRLYDELRTFLRASRNELDQAISEVFAKTGVPNPEPDRLGALPDGVDRTEVDRLTAEVGVTRARLLTLEAEYRRDHASQLYAEVKALNVDRLSLLRRLSGPKRSTITGLTYGGLDQAGAELRQVTLVLRYHVTALRSWTADLWRSTSLRSGTALTTGFTTLKWLLLFAAFWWWRRRSPVMLTQWLERLHGQERRVRASEPSSLYRGLRFLQRTRGPLEWLLFLWLLVWFLPKGSSTHLEVRVVTTIFTWILGGSFVVGIVDTWARSRRTSYGRVKGTTTDRVRLRSLRLAGRTVVVLGLILALSAQLVGKGTIYSWMLSVCWLAALPVVLIIIGWWRDIIFERVVAVRRKKAFHHWVEGHQTGWRSLPAAISAGVYLFVGGSLRIVRGWLTGFDLTRRALAYLFRRDMDRLAGENKTTVTLGPLSDELFSMLGPETFSATDLSESGDEDLKDVVDRISGKGGGVFAVVGERGRGKSTVLRRVAAMNPGIVAVDCPTTGLDGLRERIAAAVGLGPESTLDESAAKMDAGGTDTGLLIDHAHHLIHPVMGGLADFDRIIRVARANSRRCTWFFAVNEVIWRFLERARGARPLFDDVVRLGPWREEEIAGLLTSRSEQAAIQPSFEHVMETLPADADHFDRADALARVQAGYYRLIWDYSAGNAGVALHTWRRSLGLDSAGQVCVRLFRVPDTRDLEELPDHAAFVLRAVIQLEPALAADVVQATMLSPSQVEDLLGYGTTHGYFERVNDRYRVSWAWFRPITRFLQRRHLLADYE